MTTANSAQIKRVEYNFSNPALYNPVYVPLFHSRSRFIHLYGGAGSGKSIFACQKEIALSFDPSRANKRTLVVRRYGVTLSASVYYELEKIIKTWNIERYFHVLKSPMLIRNLVTGVEFIFRGLDDVEKLKSVTNVDRVFVEEATEVDNQSDIDQLDLRLRGVRNAQITLCYNPVNAFHWLNTEIHEKRPKFHQILKTTYKDNIRLQEFERRLRAEELRDGRRASDLTPTYGEILEAKRETNPNHYKIYALGEWGNNPEGLVYPDYETVSTMPQPDAYGLDFGFNDPCALVATCTVDAPDEMKKRFYVAELLYKRKHTSVTLVRRFGELQISKLIPIYADSSRPEMIAALREAGYNVIACQKGAGSVKAGIDHVKSFALKLVAGGKNLLKEISSYSWKNKNGEWLEEPEDTLNHLCDALRYAAQLQPEQEPATSQSMSVFGNKRRR